MVRGNGKGNWDRTALSEDRSTLIFSIDTF